MSMLEAELESRYVQLVFRSRHSIWVACAIVLLFNILLFYPTHIWEADLSSIGMHSRPQLLGMLLSFTLVPMWMFACFFVTQRHSLALARQLEASTDAVNPISEALIRFPKKQVIIGFAGGLFYALTFNIPWRQIGAALYGDWNILSIVIGQMMLWIGVGVLLSVRLHIAKLFSNLGKTIEFSLFEQTSLQAFARVGMLDVVIVVGGMAIATVQSLDAQFRLENYLSAIAVAAPAALALLVRPMWELHKRMALRKEELMLQINGAILHASEDTTLEHIRLLEDLLQRRDRVRAQHTWPLDISIWRRLVFYILIPPLAWVGAALMEVIVNQTLGL
jgi:hypothetical protein